MGYICWKVEVRRLLESLIIVCLKKIFICNIVSFLGRHVGILGGDISIWVS